MQEQSEKIPERIAGGEPGSGCSTVSDRLKEIAVSSLKLGCIGFGGIAGVPPLIESEYVIRRKWIDRQHFLDVVSASNIVPGPNAVEIIMHCGRERGGVRGLIVAGLSYMLPATLIGMVFGFLYAEYGELPSVQGVRLINGRHGHIQELSTVYMILLGSALGFLLETVPFS